ncbi:RDD family protein [Methanooceanicella nereidis]|nr:RDD family protein [Methanocella sp. CWC-04]
MQIDEEAKKILEKRISKAIDSIDIHSNEKQEIENELRSHFYDASLSKAQKRGSNIIEKVDVDAALEESDDPEDIAAEYVKLHADTLERAGLLSRTAAFFIDLIIVVACVSILIAPIAIPLGILSFTPGTGSTSIIAVTLWKGLGIGLYFNEIPGLTYTIISFILGAGALIVFVTYFVVIEGRYGYTPGKRLLRLKVLKEDGTRIGYKESILRNLPKFFNNLILLDALIMLIVFRKTKQRAFDKIAGTIVVHAGKPSDKNIGLFEVWKR